MLTETSKTLLYEIIGFAKDEAAKQLNDINDADAYEHMAKSGCYLQLQIRDHNEHGGRWIGQPSDASGVNWATCEGEYKFWDEAAQKVFMRIDGMPTAARALLFAMRGLHKFHKTRSVDMGFTGIIDQAFGPPNPQRILLKDILKPLHFLEGVTMANSDSEPGPDDADTELPTDFFKQFWTFAEEVIRNAPHMLRPGYQSIRSRKRVDCFSWARLLVLLFLPEDVFMQKLKEAGLVQDTPTGWHRKAREDMRAAVSKGRRSTERAAIQYGWKDLCKELDMLHTATFFPERLAEEAAESDEEGESSHTEQEGDSSVDQDKDEGPSNAPASSGPEAPTPQSRKRRLIEDSDDDEADAPDGLSVLSCFSRLWPKRRRRTVVKDSKDDMSSLSDGSSGFSSTLIPPPSLIAKTQPRSNEQETKVSGESDNESAERPGRKPLATRITRRVVKDSEDESSDSSDESAAELPSFHLPVRRRRIVRDSGDEDVTRTQRSRMERDEAEE